MPSDSAATAVDCPSSCGCDSAASISATREPGLIIASNVVTIALMPVTGLPLPLISYGGTFVLVLMFALGIVNSVWVHRHEEKKLKMENE